MISKVFIILLAVSSISADSPEVKSLVQAEEAFARMARETNTRDAFLHFFSDNVITAAHGKGPRKGKQHLEAQPVNSSLLAWRPAYSCIAASGDFGYNTGPWEFSENKTHDATVAWGQFVSVWERNKNGEWRVSLDMGISHSEPDKPIGLETSTLKPSKSAGKWQDVEQVEKSFVAHLIQEGIRAYDAMVLDETQLMRPGSQPLRGKREVQQFLTSSNRITFEPMGGDAASSGDLAYVYGKATLHPESGTETATIHSYVRIWKRQRDEWKIALELISD